MDGWTRTHSQEVMVENMGLQSLSFIDTYSFLDFWPQMGEKKQTDMSEEHEEQPPVKQADFLETMSNTGAGPLCT